MTSKELTELNSHILIRARVSIVCDSDEFIEIEFYRNEQEWSAMELPERRLHILEVMQESLFIAWQETHPAR